MKRVAEFLRSVFPADPFQFLFLFGVVCLVIAHGARWWPELGSLNTLGVLPIVFAGVAGYFVCFSPGNHPVRRIFGLIYLPTIVGLGVLLIYLDHFTGPTASVLDSTGSVIAQQISWAQAILWKAPQGFQITLIGLLLISIFTSRLAFGIASLPLSLHSKLASQPEDPALSHRVRLLTWFLVSLAFVPGGILSFITVGIPWILSSRLPPYARSAWLSPSFSVIGGLLVLGIALAIIGKDGRVGLRTLIRLPGLKWSLLALAFPIGIDVLISVGQYGLNRVQWAAHDIGRLDPPQLASYFNFSEMWWVLFILFGAFFEEVIFRGLLQARFIRKYGLYRGVFLVGIVWAAFHFYSDFSFRHFTYGEAFFQLCFRLFLCTALNFVFAWLTLRSDSIVPASIAHAFFNAFVLWPIGPSFAGKNLLRIALWAALAYSLFRHWPVRSEMELEGPTQVESAEIALGSPGVVCDEEA